jgi:pyruvate dehydrogenase (quinone)
VLPDTHPHVTGGVGYLGARPSQQAMAECDTLLIVGSGFPYIEYYPAPGQAKVVQIDIDPARIGLRFPVDAAIVGDAAQSLAALNAALDHSDGSHFPGAGPGLEGRVVGGAGRRG